MIMLGSTCSPCCGCNRAGLNSVLAALTPRVTISGSLPIPADISSRCQTASRSATSRNSVGNFSGIYVKGSLDTSPAPWVGASTHWRGYKPYSGEMIGTHALMLYPPGSSDGVYAFRRDYGDGRSVEVVFTNVGASPDYYQHPAAAKWSQGNPCYVGIKIRLIWQQPDYYTSAPVPASFALSTFSSGGGTFTVAMSDQADLFQASNQGGYWEYDNQNLRTTSGALYGTLAGVARDWIVLGGPIVKNVSVESFGLPTVADVFFGPIYTNGYSENFAPYPARAVGEFWNNSGGFSMQTMNRSGRWFPHNLQALPWGAGGGNVVTKPSLSFTGGLNKVIEVYATNAGAFSTYGISYDATVSLSLT